MKINNEKTGIKVTINEGFDHVDRAPINDNVIKEGYVIFFLKLTK
jgi:hypothetical protein